MGQITGEILSKEHSQQSINPLVMAENTNKKGKIVNLSQISDNLPLIDQQMCRSEPQLRCFVRVGGRGVAQLCCASSIDGLLLKENIINAALAPACCSSSPVPHRLLKRWSPLKCPSCCPVIMEKKMGRGDFGVTGYRFLLGWNESGYMVYRVIDRPVIPF